MEQLISTLIISPTDDILSKISSFLIEIQNDDLNIIITKFFESLFDLEHWAWEILSRDCREWHDDEKEYFQLFYNLSCFNKKLILNNNDIKTKESFLLPRNIDIINKIFQQIEKRNNDNDKFLLIINLWFDNLSLLIYEHIEFNSIDIIIYINERIVKDIIMNNQFKIYLNQLKNSSLLITNKQIFYIQTSLFLLNGYLYSKPQNFIVNGQQILEYLVEDYINILFIHHQTISSWSKELLGCITHLIGLITTCYLWIGINNEIILSNDYIELLIDIVSYRSFHEQICSKWLNNETILINNILQLFLYLINFKNIKYYLSLQKKLIETLLIFNHINNNNKISLLTYYLQSEILSEKEIKQLNISNNINDLFFYYLHQAWENSLKISIEELLKSLLNLSKNDIIKEAIINSNELQFLIDLSDEYLIIYEILWSLSFDIRIQNELRLNDKFLNKLENKQINNITEGIKWNLNLNLSNKKINYNKGKYDIILSYSNQDKLICTKIYNELIENNYHVWNNFNEINENLIDTMIQGIEESRIIIICMSEEYKRNNSCRIEAQYAFNKQLKIIPILIEKFYKPDGWLLFLIGNLFSIDFTIDEYSQGIKILLNELQNPHIAVIDSLVIRQQPQNIKNLSSKDIQIPIQAKKSNSKNCCWIM